MSPRRTADGHHVVVDGRRWRASDPDLPDELEQELVDELMAARRAVRDAGAEDVERVARDRVHDAKVALGERGPRWWEPMTSDERDRRRTATAAALARARDSDEDDRSVVRDATHAVAHLDVDDDVRGPRPTDA